MVGKQPPNLKEFRVSYFSSGASGSGCGLQVSGFGFRVSGLWITEKQIVVVGRLPPNLKEFQQIEELPVYCIRVSGLGVRVRAMSPGFSGLEFPVSGFGHWLSVTEF